MQTRNQQILNLSSHAGYREELIESAGTRIALSIYEAQGPCVIFMPGTMTHPLFYDDFLTALAENGFRAVGIHPVSHGKSPREKLKYTFADMIQNVRDTVDFCVNNFDAPVFVMGSSQGSIVAMAAAASDSRIKAVFPHNMFIPALRDTIAITRFPEFLKYFHSVFLFLMKMAATLLPGFPVPIGAYLDINKISSSKQIMDRFFFDPIGLTKYPLSFLYSLFSADMTGAADGSIQCPVVVITSTGDPLFPYPYIRQVYERIRAPKKEMLVFDEPCHLILNECVEKVIGPISEKLWEYASYKPKTIMN